MIASGLSLFLGLLYLALIIAFFVMFAIMVQSIRRMADALEELARQRQ